jgi:serine protease Do
MRKTVKWPLLRLLIALGLASLVPATLAAGQKPETRAYALNLGGEEPWLGVTLADVNQAKAQALKLPGVYGAIVTSVEPNSPAAKAGLEKNDVILQFAGDRVWSAAELARMVHETPAGRPVNLKVSRNGKTMSLKATIEDHPSVFFNMPPSIRAYPYFKAEPLPNPQAPGMSHSPYFWEGPLPPSTPFNNPLLAPGRVLGISGDDLTPQLARYFRVAQGKGVLVTSVIAGSPASKAGLKAGDVIVKAGAEEVDSVAGLRWALQTQQTKSHQVTLTIVRNGREQTVTAVLEPLGSEQLQSAEDWSAWGLTPAEESRLEAKAKELAAQAEALKAEYQPGSPKYQEMLEQARRAAKQYEAKAGEYQKKLEQMQQQLRRQLEPMKQNLQRELEQEKQQLEKQKELLRRFSEKSNEV